MYTTLMGLFYIEITTRLQKHKLIEDSNNTQLIILYNNSHNITNNNMYRYRYI